MRHEILFRTIFLDAVGLVQCYRLIAVHADVGLDWSAKAICLTWCVGGVSSRCKSIQESRRLHPRLGDKRSGVVLWISSLSLQRGSV